MLLEAAGVSVSQSFAKAPGRAVEGIMRRRGIGVAETFQTLVNHHRHILLAHKYGTGQSGTQDSSETAKVSTGATIEGNGGNTGNGGRQGGQGEDPFNFERPNAMPNVDNSKVPAAHVDLPPHYRAMREEYSWNEYRREDADEGGEVWRHPDTEKESFERRHEDGLADFGRRIVSLPENFQGQVGKPPDLEIDEQVAQLRFRQPADTSEPTIEMQRKVRRGRKSAPVVVYVN
jgi:hypothetical protein